MLTNVLLVKISLALAALLAFVGLWYQQYRQDTLKRALEHQIVRRHPSREQREEADRIYRNEMTGEGLARSRQHFLETLGGKK